MTKYTLTPEHENTVDVIVLGGGDGEPVDSITPVKGLVKVLDKSMIEWVVDALREAKSVREIAIVIPDAKYIGDELKTKVNHIVECDKSFTDNALAGADVLKNDLHILGVTADIPALTPEAVDDFVEQTLRANVDFAYPLIRKEHLEEQFPGSVRTYIKIKGGPVTGGNFFLGSPEFKLRIKDTLQQLFETRKNPLKMVRTVGPRFVFNLASGKLDVTEVEKKMGELLGGPCAAIYTEYAAIGADVDKPVDLEVIEAAILATHRSIV
ncbi:MAG: NTP transferase domain-containing protein [Coriobacteriia bacterium]|nr:NTP transferase domain-containing protein [Coriobacteriia bacterium]